MPSLRRSASSPAVRSTPYTINQSSSLPPSQGKRRGSTATSGRAVLAEISWWSVMRGQDPEVDENEDEDGSSAPNVDEDQLIAEAVRAAVSSAHPSVVPSVSAYDSSPSPTSSDHYLEPTFSVSLSPTSSTPSSTASSPSPRSVSSSPTTARRRLRRQTRHTFGPAASIPVARQSLALRSLSFGGFDLRDALIQEGTSLDDMVIADSRSILPVSAEEPELPALESL